MFQGLLKRAERSLDSVVAKFVGRAMVAVPLLVAAGFATAALAVKLVTLYGHVTAYALMAALFAVIGLITMAIVAIEQRPASETAATESEASAGDTSEEATPDVADLFGPEVRSVLASAAPVALPGMLRGVGRNLPLILVLAIIAVVIAHFGETSEDQAAQGQTKPDDSDPDADTATPPMAA